MSVQLNLSAEDDRLVKVIEQHVFHHAMARYIMREDMVSYQYKGTGVMGWAGLGWGIIRKEGHEILSAER